MENSLGLLSNPKWSLFWVALKLSFKGLTSSVWKEMDSEVQMMHLKNLWNVCFMQFMSLSTKCSKTGCAFQESWTSMNYSTKIDGLLLSVTQEQSVMLSIFCLTSFVMMWVN